MHKYVLFWLPEAFVPENIYIRLFSTIRSPYPIGNAVFNRFLIVIFIMKTPKHELMLALQNVNKRVSVMPQAQRHTGCLLLEACHALFIRYALQNFILSVICKPKRLDRRKFLVNMAEHALRTLHVDFGQRQADTSDLAIVVPQMFKNLTQINPKFIFPLFTSRASRIQRATYFSMGVLLLSHNICHVQYQLS